MKDIIGDSLIIAFGITLVYIFVVIELLGFYGHEPNKIMRWVELIMGAPIIFIGVERLIDDIRNK